MGQGFAGGLPNPIEPLCASSLSMTAGADYVLPASGDLTVPIDLP